jgi:hypothetical protein
MANNNETNNGTNNEMEQILNAINNINGKIDSIQKDVNSMKDDMINLKKRQDDTDEKFKKMQSVINDAVEEEKKASSNNNQPAKETIKDKIKGNLKFIIPAGVVLTAAGGALAYAIYKNKSTSVDVIDDVDGDDVLDM